MTDDEVRGRLVVLEAFCMGTLGLIFTLTGSDDPGHQKAIITLNALQATAKDRLVEAADPAIVQPGEAYLDELLSILSENLGVMRPKRSGS